MTADMKAKRLLQLLENLVNVLEEETLLLRAPRSVELGPVVRKKQELLAEYELYLQELAQTPHFFQALTDDMRTNLKTLSERFQNAALENEKRLSLATRSSQMIADRIKEEAKKAMGTTVKGYGSTGGYSKGTEKRTAPIAVNQTL